MNHSSCICTEDGVYLVTEPGFPTVSARTRAEAEAEIRRLKTANRSYAGLDIVHRHTDIRTVAA